MLQIADKPNVIKQRLSDGDLAFFKELILKKREEAEEELEFHQSALKNRIDSDDDGYASSTHHMADAASGAEEIDLYYRLIERNRAYINQLNRALERINNKTYGLCRISGRPIARERLIAVPHTRYEVATKQKGLDKQLN